MGFFRGPLKSEMDSKLHPGQLVVDTLANHHSSEVNHVNADGLEQWYEEYAAKRGLIFKRIDSIEARLKIKNSIIQDSKLKSYQPTSIHLENHKATFKIISKSNLTFASNAI